MKDLEKKFDLIIELVKSEFISATNKFGPFHNAHEGYAVLLEEVNELWDNIKLNQSDPDRNNLIGEEAVQVAAMAIRIIFDCVDVII